MRGEAKVTLPKSVASVCHVTPRCEHALFLQECFFDFMFRFVCNGWQNQAMCLHQVLKISKSATETPEMLCEAFGEHSLSRTAFFLMAFMFQGWSSGR
jgi:hypothetical protein